MTEAELLALIERAAREEWEELDLSGNELTELPPQIGKLAKLQRLILGKWEKKNKKCIGNKLTYLPAEIGELSSLKTLNLSGNQLTKLPDEIGQLNKLNSIDLRFNKLSKLPSRFNLLYQLKSINLYKNLLTSLPEEIVQLEDLRSLSVSFNRLKELPAEIVKLTKLESIYLSFNRLSELPTEILHLANIKTLSLSFNKISTLSPEIGQLKNLKTLYLSFNKLRRLPIEIGQLTNLESLDLYENHLIELPAEIGQLTNLQSLSLSFNELCKLPTEFGKLNNLKFLNLRKNKLSCLPIEIKQLIKLRYLYVSDNQLRELPTEIVGLTDLELLDLRRNKLKELSPEIGRLKKLVQLYLTSNHLRELPVEIGQLKNLKELYLTNNQLRRIPIEIGQLRQLRLLSLNHNQLKQLPTGIIPLKNLYYLDLWNNQLCRLPKEVVKDSKLQFLDLGYNYLCELPEVIGQLLNLKSLKLDFNQISKLSEEIRQLSNLETIEISYNQLSELPAEISQLHNLRNLNLFGNQLSQLSEGIYHLSSQLQNLDLRANPLPIPPEILGSKDFSKSSGKVKEILDFYFRIQDPNETELLYEAKFLIVGEGAAGKTSLAEKIRNENYELKPDEESTEGIDVIRWEFPLPDGNSFRVNIWDFGGQEIYHQTHQFFLTERSLYALVVDTRRENTDLNWWLKVVELLSDNSPVLLIKNEKQDRQCEINERQLRGEFSNLRNILATNLSTNRGLEEIKSEIAREIQRLPHVGQPLPKIWVRVRAALENHPQNYIADHEYYKLCDINGVKKQEEMLQLSRYLHDLGVYLHFQKDPVLKHWIILKPEWGTDAVYKVLDNKQVRDDFGRFTLEDVKSIWHEGEYGSMQDELMQLMLNFKVCYEIPGAPKNYIAPHLLSTDQAKYHWNQEKNLILRYEYEFMPKGILTRFIVEMHRYIEEQKQVWKNGVVLQNHYGRAEIIENYRPSKGEIKIRVSGLDKKALMAIITNKFFEIHSSFERLRYQTWIPCNCSVCKPKVSPKEFPLDTLRKFREDGEREIQCTISYKMVNVRSLLDDVNFSTHPHDERDTNTKDNGSKSKNATKPPTRDQVFISYSHEDKKWFDELKLHLDIDQQLQVWDDQKIRAGDLWRKEINQALLRAKVAVLLVSPHFLRSDFIKKKELPPILNAAKNKGLTIVWIPISFCRYKKTEIEQYQAAYSPKEPLDGLNDSKRNGAWVKICEKIEEAAGES